MDYEKLVEILLEKIDKQETTIFLHEHRIKRLSKKLNELGVNYENI